MLRFALNVFAAAVLPTQMRDKLSSHRSNFGRIAQQKLLRPRPLQLHATQPSFVSGELAFLLLAGFFPPTRRRRSSLRSAYSLP